MIEEENNKDFYVEKVQKYKDEVKLKNRVITINLVLVATILLYIISPLIAANRTGTDKIEPFLLASGGAMLVGSLFNLTITVLRKVGLENRIYEIEEFLNRLEDNFTEENKNRGRKL